MKKERKVLYLLLITLLFAAFWFNSQATAENAQQPSSIIGRLNLEKHGQEEWLILHAKDAKTYLIAGKHREKLKGILQKLGQDHLVFVFGELDGDYRISCTHSYKYEEDKKGEKKLKTDVACIRYYLLNVTDIGGSKKTNEALPLPQRDEEAEKRAITATTPTQALMPKIIGEIYGEVEAVNLKSAFKTVEVQNQDKASPIKNITLVIGPETRIAKKIGKEEPVGLSVEALKKGQAVAAMYSKDEFKNEALFITITKE